MRYTITHPGQNNYGQILQIRLLRPEIISKMLDGRAFSRLQAISEWILHFTQNNIFFCILDKVLDITQTLYRQPEYNTALRLWRYNPNRAWTASFEVSTSYTMRHTHTHTHTHTDTHTHTFTIRQTHKLSRIFLNKWSAASQRPLPTQETNTHVLSGIRNRDPSNETAADLCFRPQGHRNRQNTT
jgi:hypothetical protein